MKSETNNLISYQYQLRKMGIEDLMVEYQSIKSNISLKESDIVNLLLIDKLSIQLTGKKISELDNLTFF